jgi:hypothetical protein
MPIPVLPSASRVNYLVQTSGVPAFQRAYLHTSASSPGSSPLPYNEFVDFKLVSNYKPQGDQAQAIEALTRGVFDREQHQVLLGVTGSGKTFTAAKVIEAANRPALVMAHNKTLAAQLYHEFKSFFPHNAVEYFVSYYDFYQPEAYVPAADLYIEKESTINDELDKLRLSATRSLFERRDCLDRGLGQLHLWLGIARGLLRHDAVPGEGTEDQALGHHPQAGRYSLRAHRRAISAAVLFACAAMSSKSIPPMTTTPIAWKCSATRLNRSRRSILCSGRSSSVTCGCRFIPRRTT